MAVKKPLTLKQQKIKSETAAHFPLTKRKACHVIIWLWFGKLRVLTQSSAKFQLQCGMGPQDEQAENISESWEGRRDGVEERKSPNLCEDPAVKTLHVVFAIDT
uniref:Uncharacterized protein n=1 Tax=Sphaerodactylus townsendi TaxID=933632 RepID=A0ACB8FEI1_9SAUR